MGDFEDIHDAWDDMTLFDQQLAQAQLEERHRREEERQQQIDRYWKLVQERNEELKDG